MCGIVGFFGSNLPGCQEETHRRGEGRRTRHRCGGGLRCTTYGNHQIEDFDGGLVTLGAYRPGRGAWDTERDPSGVSGAKECVIRLKVPQHWGMSGGSIDSNEDRQDLCVHRGLIKDRGAFRRGKVYI